MTRRALLKFLGLAPLLAPAVAEAFATERPIAYATGGVVKAIPGGKLIIVGEMHGTCDAIIPLKGQRWPDWSRHEPIRITITNMAKPDTWKAWTTA